MHRFDKARACCTMASGAAKLAASGATLRETTRLLQIANAWLVLARRINTRHIEQSWRESGQRWLH